MAVIRKQRGSFWSNIREAPRDWLLHLAEDYEVIDWNRISEATSWPCALAFNGLFVLVSLARQLSARSSDIDAIVDSQSKYKATGSSRYWDDAPESSSPYGQSPRITWAGAMLFLQIFLFALSAANAWRLFSSRRTYQLRMKDADARSLSSSCRRVTLGTRRPQWAHSLWGRLLWMLWKWIARVDDKIEGEIWELSMWTPNTFSRNLFCWCSPVQLLILSFMDGSNWYYILPLSAAVATQCTFLVVTYATLVKDKQLLFSEVYNEYNQKFVHPRVFVPKRDAATSTLEDWIEARKDAAANTDSNIAAARAWRIGRVHERRATTMATQEIDPRGYLPNDAAEPVSREHRREMGRSKDVPPPITSNTDTRARDHHLRRTTMYTGPARASDEFGDFENEHEGPQPSYSSAGHPQHVPSGTQKIRDRSAKRRRHTEIVERMRREK